MLLWLGFALAIALLLVISRRSLALGMAVASIVLAAFSLPPSGWVEALRVTAADPGVWLLALVVGLIPIIGGVMETSGEMARLVSNLRIGIRPFLALSPALLGMLPMPGGALLSAPLIERGAGHTAPDVKAAANVWFRHALLLVYPLGSALIASAKIASLNVYAVIPFLAPTFLLSLVLGYVFLLRRANGELAQSGSFSLPGLLVPLAIILAAPLIDVSLKASFALPVAELGTAVGVLASLGLAVGIGRMRPAAIFAVVRRMKPWKYAAIILAMFVFLNVFTSSGAPERLAALRLPPAVLSVVIGFALGAITGRIQAPMSIIIPIYATTYGALSPAAFAVTFFAVFLGYVLTPIHPCISVSVEYFRTPMTAFVRRLAWPVGISFAITLAAGWWLL